MKIGTNQLMLVLIKKFNLLSPGHKYNNEEIGSNELAITSQNLAERISFEFYEDSIVIKKYINNSCIEEHGVFVEQNNTLSLCSAYRKPNGTLEDLFYEKYEFPDNFDLYKDDLRLAKKVQESNGLLKMEQLVDESLANIAL